LFNSRASLLFITLPQVLLGVFLTYTYRSIGIVPALPLVIIFSVQAALNLYIAADAVIGISDPLRRKYANAVRFIGFLAVMSAADPFLLRQFSFESALSPETIYAALSLIPLIYVCVSVLQSNGAPLRNVRNMIIICICLPLTVAGFIPLVIFAGPSPYGRSDGFTGLAADLIILVLFALFFVFICLAASIVYHYRVKRSARLDAERTGGEADTPTDVASASNANPVKKSLSGYTIFVALIALILPVACLILNRTVFNDMIGDFSGKWFYILTVVNGAAMLIPRKNKWLTLAALFFKSMGFLFVFYFAVVLLKFTPLMLASFYFLVTTLVLVPIILLVVEMFQLFGDFKYLSRHFTTGRAAAVFVSGMLFLCVGFAGSCYVQKVNVNNALRYLNENEPEYPPVNVSMLRMTLAHSGQARWTDRGGSLFGDGGTPLLSEVYSEFVLGGKDFGDSYADMAKMFFPGDLPHSVWKQQYDAMKQEPQFNTSGGEPQANAAEEKSDVKLSAVEAETSFDQSTGLYKTWIHLQMENVSRSDNREYEVRFALPDGVFITDYYLDVFGVRKYGIISEKNSAQTLYNSIVSRKRDPGIICYEYGNTVVLKVFPFSVGETRAAGFMVTHKQSESISISGNTVELRGDELAEPVIAGDVCFMPSSYKAKLAEADERMPKYYFIADVSKPYRDSDEWLRRMMGVAPDSPNITLEDIHARISQYAQSNQIENADVYLTDYHVKKTDLKNLKLKYGEGGFNLSLAVSIIYQDVQRYPGFYPVVMIVSDNIYRANITDNRQFTRDFPESEYYYLIESKGLLTPFRFLDNAKGEKTEKPSLTRTLAYCGFYFRDNAQSEVSYQNTLGFSDITYGSDPYVNALLLNSKIGKAGTNAEKIEVVKDSFRQRVLAKNTAFIVLETKEQEDELIRRNKEFLEGGGRRRGRCVNERAGSLDRCFVYGFYVDIDIQETAVP